VADTIAITDLAPPIEAACRHAGLLLNRAVNIPTGTVVAAVAVTEKALYGGASLWLSGTSNVHAETAAITSACSAGDPAITAICLAGRRGDGTYTDHVTPCGGCGQLLTDLAIYTGHPITIYSPDSQLNRVRVIPHIDLLPHAYVSRRLSNARMTSWPAPMETKPS
jgi:cytidine deaminase